MVRSNPKAMDNTILQKAAGSSRIKYSKLVLSFFNGELQLTFTGEVHSTNFHLCECDSVVDDGLLIFHLTIPPSYFLQTLTFAIRIQCCSLLPPYLETKAFSFKPTHVIGQTLIWQRVNYVL